MSPSTISGINRLPEEEKRAIFRRIIPHELLERFNLPESLVDENGNPLLIVNAKDGRPTAAMALYHQHGFPDPLFYGEITDTLNGQLHILVYVVNDVTGQRFDVDRLPDGTPTEFGVLHRNIPAEIAAMEYGLAPGQIRRGLRILGEAARTFEDFVSNMSHEMYFAEPLYYHNAILFERYGFAYQQGRRMMQDIHARFGPGGDLRAKLDGSTPFRPPEAADSIRLRSWAIHDGVLGEPFTRVTMYKRVGKDADIDTAPGVEW